jgi:hypothetical protein
MSTLYGAQRMILQAIRDLPKDSSGYVTNRQIADYTKIAIGDVDNWIGTLEAEGHVELARRETDISVLITPKGQLVLGPSPDHSESRHEQLESDSPTHRPRPKLLPVSDATPAVMGIAVDVSASMLTSIGPITGQQKNRLQSVLQSVKGMAVRHQSFPPISVFAYGFGFRDTAADFGGVVDKWGGVIGSFLNMDIKVPISIKRGRVRDLFDLAGFTPSILTLEEISHKWARLESGLQEQKIDLGGDTPMGPAIDGVDKRFMNEFGRYGGTPYSALLIVSDGESTEGDPRLGCQRIAERGTMVMCCYLNATDVVEPKTLYGQARAEWPDGAKTLFACSK